MNIHPLIHWKKPCIWKESIHFTWRRDEKCIIKILTMNDAVQKSWLIINEVKRDLTVFFSKKISFFRCVLIIFRELLRIYSWKCSFINFQSSYFFSIFFFSWICILYFSLFDIRYDWAPIAPRSNCYHIHTYNIGTIYMYICMLMHLMNDWTQYYVHFI